MVPKIHTKYVHLVSGEILSFSLALAPFQEDLDVVLGVVLPNRIGSFFREALFKDPASSQGVPGLVCEGHGRDHDGPGQGDGIPAQASGACRIRNVGDAPQYGRDAAQHESDRQCHEFGVDSHLA